MNFSLTVKVATLIFISGRGSAISSAKQGKSGFIYNLAFFNNFFGPRKILTVYSVNSHLLILKAHNHKMYVFCCPLKYLKPHRQTVWTQIRLIWVHNVCLYAYMLNRHFQMQLFCWRFKD